MFVHQLDPVAVQLGSIAIHWYGIMYLVGFGAAWWLGRRRTTDAFRGWQRAAIDDLVFYCALGAVLGGRIGVMLFYQLDYFLHSPWIIFQIWQGGMSFHGGLIGVLVAMWWYARRHGRTFFEVTDFIAPLVPPGLGAGRLGNFINGELWGKTTDLPWGVVFPYSNAGPLPRHPSQLYEAFLEGAVLFAILWLFSKKPRPIMAVSGLFLLGYGIFRFLVEFVRVPDESLGYLAFDWLTMGQVLSIPMLVVGVGLLFLAYIPNGHSLDSRGSGR
uniref:Phosphatidylglycerol--prolipoprotein diacylglyceryl transferase n=1 Tax=Candidatus Kentrum sp. FM TaxID=2126340 RepID=A0A450SUL5_9GAMM|nr:MAG: phosphatidylglycerol:prolipoprotein diacylglycerol transferase [Candidatus Kentron sp. FM]VFJ57919.1 MAG: phosphatidylglycerol:prolipoprotein diacylglycerol transferase [Candidatus Kentron sp. FM]VFK09849.1 MAG: phosphatidylglycerol:prolipoprotein diacylglycerol transferase [Candidatus Kentron sp. FM]